MDASFEPSSISIPLVLSLFLPFFGGGEGEGKGNGGGVQKDLIHY